jgi:hypothetical protein
MYINIVNKNNKGLQMNIVRNSYYPKAFYNQSEANDYKSANRRKNRERFAELGIEKQTDFKPGIGFETPLTEVIITDVFYKDEYAWREKPYRRLMVKSISYHKTTGNINYNCTHAANMFNRNIIDLLDNDRLRILKIT